MKTIAPLSFHVTVDAERLTFLVQVTVGVGLPLAIHARAAEDPSVIASAPPAGVGFTIGASAGKTGAVSHTCSSSYFQGADLEIS